MTTRTYLLGTLVGAFSLFGAASCGDNIECGEGTVEVDGTCVPTADVCGSGATWNDATGECEANCAEGTTLVNNECVPDGTVICETGTTYNPDTGKCDPDITGCSEGMVLVDGVCVDEDDTLADQADYTEDAEPNDIAHTPQAIDLPEIGSDITIYGCTDPYEDADDSGNLDPDEDAYYFTVTGQTLLEITADGIHGLAGGFAVFGSDDQLLDEDGYPVWMRFGVNLVNDTSQRQVFLPKAGTYYLILGDSRGFMFGEGAGDGDTCYFATVRNIAIPTPTAFEDEAELLCEDGTTTCDTNADCDGIGSGACTMTIASTIGNDVQFYSYDPDDGDILWTTMSTESEAMIPATVNEVNTALHSFADGSPAEGFIPMLAGSDNIVMVVDQEYNIGLVPAEYLFSVSDPGATALPEDGDTSITHVPGYYSWLYFNGDAGDVMHLTMDTTADLECQVIDMVEGVFISNYMYAGYDAWIQLLNTGMYYVRCYNNDEADWTATWTRNHVVPTALEVGTAVTGAALTDDNVNWFELDVSDSDWLVYTADPSNFDGNMDVMFYSRTNGGELDYYVPQVDGFSLTSTDDEYGRIVVDDDSVFLIGISDDAFTAGGATFDFLVNDRTFTDLGTVDADNPIDEADISIAADERQYFLAYVTPGTLASIDLVGTGDTPVTVGTSWLDNEETAIDTAGDGVTMTVNLGFRDSFIAFAVDETASQTGTFDLGGTATDAAYIVTQGTMAFTSVCPDAGGLGEDHELTDSDDGLSVTPIALGFTFDFWDDTSATEATVSSNGWVTLTTDYAGGAVYSNAHIPDAADPNALIAPDWMDMYYGWVCTYQSASQLIIEWNGYSYDFDYVEFQAKLHDDGSIDFVYGPDHEPVGEYYDAPYGTVGIENQAGDAGIEIGYDEWGLTDPGTSYTLTPNW